MRVAILASGGGTTAAAICEAAAASSGAFTVAVIIGNNSRAGAREVAQRHAVPFVHLSGHTHPHPADLDRAVRDTLIESNVDLVVLAGYMKQLGPQTLSAFEKRVINTHPALLPSFGGHGFYGDRVHRAVLASGVATSGATVHEVTAEYDQGPVIQQRIVPVLPDDSLESLRTRVQVAEKALLIRVIRDLSAQGTAAAS